MRFVDEFRDPEIITRTCEEIRRLADPGRHYRIMEVCGGHTHAIYRFGLKDVLPPNIEFIHGPGCPVCVLPMGRIDDGLALGKQDGVIFTAFGDMMRVPGAHGQPARAEGRGHGRPHRLLPVRRPQAGPRQPRQARDVLRDRLRDHGAVHGAHADAGPGARASGTSRSSATTSRSFPPSAPSSTRPTCGWTRSSARATSPPSSAAGRTSGSRGTRASRSWCPASSRSTCSSRSSCCFAR